MDLRAIPDKVSSALGLGSSSEKPTGKTDPTSLAAREKALQEARRADPLHPPTEHELKATPQSEIKWDASKPMLAAEWQGTRKIVVTTRASPCVTDPKDAVVRVTSASVCGTDLHMYQNQVPGEANKSGDIMGHESMGIVESVGDQCTKVKVGDRVIVSAVLCCGECDQCKAGRTSMCPKLNPAADLEKLMGARNAGLLGIGHTNGAYSGGQAERVRIPFADVNLMPLPADKLTDQQLLLLSDVACTGFHGTELADVKEGQTVCIWGGGPVGLMAGMLALKLRKASRVCIIDGNAYRLAFAAKLGMEGVNYHEVDNVVNELMRRFPLGADAGIDCAGYRYPRGMLHKAMRAVRLETDSAEIITEMAQVVRPGGRLALIGEYFGMANAFPIGALMQKDLTLRGGPVYLHQYVPYILSKVQDGTIDLTPWFTHSVDLSDIAEAYRMFDQREDEVLKIHVVTEFGKQRGQLGNKLPLPPKLEESAHATAAAPSK